VVRRVFVILSRLRSFSKRMGEPNWQREWLGIMRAWRVLLTLGVLLSQTGRTTALLLRMRKAAPFSKGRMVSGGRASPPSGKMPMVPLFFNIWMALRSGSVSLPSRFR